MGTLGDASDDLHEPMQARTSSSLPIPGSEETPKPEPPNQELRLLWRRRNLQPGAGSRLPHTWKEKAKEDQTQPMQLLIVHHKKDSDYWTRRRTQKTVLVLYLSVFMNQGNRKRTKTSIFFLLRSNVKIVLQ